MELEDFNFFLLFMILLLETGFIVSFNLKKYYLSWEM